MKRKQAETTDAEEFPEAEAETPDPTLIPAGRMPVRAEEVYRV